MRGISYEFGGLLKWIVGFCAVLLILYLLDPSLYFSFVTIIKQFFALAENGLDDLLDQGY